MKYSSQANKGLSFIELMASVAILAIISVIAFPNYLLYNDRAHIRACLSEATALARIVLVAKHQDDRNLLPPLEISACSATSYNAATIPTANFTFTAKNSGTPAIITCDYQTGVCTSDQ